MRIKSIRRIKLDEPVKVYDLVDAGDGHCFLAGDSQGFAVAHNCAMLDELDFAKGQDSSLEKSDILRLYNSVKRRIESRFMKKGGLVPGLLFMVSSKNSVYDFLETYINMNRHDPHLFIVDDPIWVVKETLGLYSGNVFKLAVGDRYYPSRILADGEDAEAVSRQQRVIDVPVEYRGAFETDMNTALADIAGIAIVSASKYFTADKVIETYREYLQNPFIMEEVSLGFDDDSQLKDFVDEKLLPTSNRGTQSYHIHWDVSKNGDRTGLSMTTSTDLVKVNRLVKGEVSEVVDVIHKLVFAVGIVARPGEEIPFYKIREFVYWLRDIGFNIVTITCDSFQCLPGYAKVITELGNKSISELQPTDRVLSYDKETDSFSFAEYKNLRVTGYADRLCRIEINGDTVCECTYNHPFLTPGGFIQARYLKAGDFVALADRSAGKPSRTQGTVTQTSIDYLQGKIPVYDIEVPEKHCFVLEGGAIVHNSVDTIQQFKLQGFDSYTLSVDRSRAPYDALKNAVNEGRLIAPKIKLLEKEYLDVEDDRVKNKIDHTPNGSKDILDSVAANVFKAGMKEAPPITSNTANSFLLINEQEDEEEENWLLPKGTKIIDNGSFLQGF